ncbi:signal transduction histidine kinase [Lipingzhangella halophila]|uniref:histidine kinase n=1 Tax=Lipingzhangella halophila TaxID=1783352 RepID=A0A7W7RCJ5_9ACTN|nr:histidine kinase [Lipingzhangella halophila]MBB4929507.1 signal transduction histidine kinase [Lipingzhangella halophila]
MTFDDTVGAEDSETGRAHEPSRAPTACPVALLTAGLTRLGLSGPVSRDILLAVLATLVSVSTLVVLNLVARAEGAEFAPATMTALTVLTCAQSLVLCVRRRSPLLCLSIVVLTQVAVLALLPADVAFQGVAPFIAAYTCATILAPRRLVWVLLAATVVHTAGGLAFASFPLASGTPLLAHDFLGIAAAQALSAVFSYGVVGFIGSDVATRRRFARLERLREAEAQRERTNSAIRAERTRMARELHDIAAHHLSGMVVQAGAAEQLIGRDDRAAAEMTAWVRSQGKETLDSLRMVVGTLREPGEHPPGTSEADEGEAEGAPVPGIAVLDRLVAGERALGSEVTLERTGGAYDLPPVADVTFYRVAQEALANARDHAWGARVRVELDYRESEVVLQVENEPGVERAESPADSRGMGLVGMRERAYLIGAVLETGPTDSGGWHIRLTLPFTRRISANGADRATAKDAPHDQGGPG